VWIDGVPPGRQPGVTDCAYAYSHVPPNGRVIYGGRAPQRSYAQNRQYAPYYYGVPRQGDPNGNYIERVRDRLNTARAQQLRTRQQSAYIERGDQHAPIVRSGDDDRSGRKWKREKEHENENEQGDDNGHGHGHGNGHGKHHD
jgi:hypothetical protein